MLPKDGNMCVKIQMAIIKGAIEGKVHITCLLYTSDAADE